jgi:hypothetical protein
MTYEGEALENNTMDVKDLAPSLLALGQMFERANSLFNRSNAEISLNIKAICLGSFNVALMLNQLIGYSASLSPDLLI